MYLPWSVPDADNTAWIYPPLPQLFHHFKGWHTVSPIFTDGTSNTFPTGSPPSLALSYPHQPCPWNMQYFFCMALLLHSDGDDTTILLNIRNYSPKETAPHPRHLASLATPLWEPQSFKVTKDYSQSCHVASPLVKVTKDYSQSCHVASPLVKVNI